MHYRKLKYTIQNCKIDFTSSSYLNLHTNKDVIAKSIEYINKYGTSFTSSPLIGRSEIYQELSDLLESIYNKKILIFPSGYQLNSTVISSLLKDDDIIAVFDQLNHASMNYGLLMSKKVFYRYKNCNLNALEDILKKYQNQGKRIAVFTESVFSMDGSMINIDEMIFLKRKYNFLLYIDEAHSVGLYGKNGYGICYEYKDEIEFIMATFSKAIGSQGAFIATNSDYYEKFVNKCSGLIYSTGLSPANVGATFQSFKLISDMNKDREKIGNLSIYLAKKLNIEHLTNIFPIIFQNNEDGLETYNNLINNQINTSFISYPTVPMNQPRLRVCINSNHTYDSINELLLHLST